MKKAFKASSSWLGALVVAMLVLLTVITGCGRASSKQEKQEIDVTPYLGTWECVGVWDGDGTQSLEDYAASTGEPYSATMVVRDNGFAYLLEDDGGKVNSSVIPWLRQDYKVIGDEERHKEVPTGPLYSAGYFELDDDKLIKPFSDDKKLVFSRQSDSLGPLLRPAILPGCTVDIPIELMDDYEWQIDNLGGAETMATRENIGLKGESVEGREYTSVHIYANHSSKGRDDHPEGEEVVVDGNTLYLESDTTDSSVKKVVQFVLPDQGLPGYELYEITFYYDVNEAAYYEDYAESFIDNVHIGNDIMPDVESVSDSSEELAPTDPGYLEGVISWQDAPQHVGEHVEIFGTVAATNYSPKSDGQPTFIDIGEAYPSPNRVTAVIWGEDRGNFPSAPEDMYAGRYIKVEGELYQYDGSYNIRVFSPDQIVAR